MVKRGKRKFPLRVLDGKGKVIAKFRYVPDVEGAMWGWSGVVIEDTRPYADRLVNTPWGASPEWMSYAPPTKDNPRPTKETP